MTEQPKGHNNNADLNNRFRTRTISSQDEDDPLFTPQASAARTFKFNDTSSDSTSLDDDVAVVAAVDKSSLRALTERYKFIRNPIVNGTSCFPPTPPPTARTPSQQDGPPTFITNGNNLLNEDSLDFEQNSETESCFQNHCIDDCTYTLEPAPIQPPQKAKPKICKPAETTPGQTPSPPPENNKVIRGKKKAAYVSPYKKTSTSIPQRPLSARSLPKPSTTTTTTISPVESTKKSIAKLMPRQGGVVVAKTHVLINKSNLTNKINVSRTAMARPGFHATAAKTVAAKNQLNRPAPAMPERQGTFVKDEPTVDGVPVVVATSAPASPARSRLPSKVPPAATAAGTTTPPTSPAKGSFISKLKNPLQRSASIGGAAAAAKTSAAPASRRTTPSSSTNDLAAPKRRISGSSTFYRSPSTPTVPQRSNSNSSLKSSSSSGKRAEPFATQPPSRSNSNLTPALAKTSSNITSRIAGMWKKQEPKFAATKPAVNGKPPPGNRLIRSSTFDNSPGEECAKIVNGTNQRGGGANKDVIRRVKTAATGAVDETKRISRLGTFINVDEAAA